MADEEMKTEPVETPQTTTPTPESKEPPRSTSTEWAVMTSWFNTAKQKAMETVDLMKKDLSELKDTMATEVNEITTAAKEGVGSAVTAVTQQLEHLGLSQEEAEKEGTTTEEKTKEEPKDGEESNKSGFGLTGWLPKINLDSTTNFLDSAVNNLQKAFTIVPDDDEEFTEAIRPKMGRNTRISRDQLRKIQCDEAVYLNEPSDKKTYDKWLSTYSFAEHQGEAHMLLKNNKTVMEMYDKHVSSEKVSDNDFWARYFFAVEIAELNEEINASLSDKTIATQPVTEQPTSPARSADDWSICSDKNEIEEVSSTKSEEDSPGTPLPPTEKKEGDWVDWDE